MKKIALMFVAAAAIGLAVPASAQTVVIRDGMHRHHGVHHDRGYRARAEWRHRRHNTYVKPYHHHRRHGGPAIVIRP